jgi:hypothetical protein
MISEIDALWIAVMGLTVISLGCFLLYCIERRHNKELIKLWGEVGTYSSVGRASGS